MQAMWLINGKFCWHGPHRLLCKINEDNLVLKVPPNFSSTFLNDVIWFTEYKKSLIDKETWNKTSLTKQLVPCLLMAWHRPVLNHLQAQGTKWVSRQYRCHPKIEKDALLEYQLNCTWSDSGGVHGVKKNSSLLVITTITHDCCCKGIVNIKMSFSIGIPIIMIRGSHDRFIFIVKSTWKDSLYTETWFWPLQLISVQSIAHIRLVGSWLRRLQTITATCVVTMWSVDEWYKM